MILKGIFIQYLLFPLLALLLVGVMVAIKKKNEFINNKKLIVYVLLAMLLCAVPGLGGLMGNAFSPWGYLLAQLTYLACGSWHVSLMRHYFTRGRIGPGEGPAAKRKRNYAILFEILLTLLIIIAGVYLFTLLFNWLSPYKGYAMMAASSISTFIVPLIFLYTYQRFTEIPFAIYKVWQFIPGQSADTITTADIDSLMLIRLELTKTVSDGRRIILQVKAPQNITLGNWMSRVLDDHNEKNQVDRIDTISGEGEAYGWIFYMKPSFFKPRHYLDYEKTIAGNGIKARYTLVCRRVINGAEERTVAIQSKHN